MLFKSNPKIWRAGVEFQISEKRNTARRGDLAGRLYYFAYIVSCKALKGLGFTWYVHVYDGNDTKQLGY